MRVDDVPLWLKPAFHLYGYAVGGAFQLANSLIRHGCRHVWEHRTTEAGPRIECIWHEHLPTYLATYLPGGEGVRYAWMNHPIWYMRPVHLLLAWNGVEEIALGSTGHGGRAALARVVEWLREGYRTTMAVDGPAGPPRILKPGALDMARASGRPIVAIRFDYERAVRTREWDRKWLPLPGSRVHIRESEPLYVTDDNYDAQRERLASLL
jgi:lysophospholipid acyltransferase (LPLAT)-like uncharacterized protein